MSMSVETGKTIKLKKKLHFAEVDWSLAESFLQGKFKFLAEDAERDVKSFFQRFLRPFNTYWFINHRLSDADNRLMAAVCECNGADSLSLIREKSYRVAGIGFKYNLNVDFVPSLKNFNDPGNRGICSPCIEVSIFGKTLGLRTLPSMVAFHSLLFCLATISYLVGVALLLYGLAVLRVFLSQPVADSWGAIVHNDALVLALMCFLIGMAAIFGRSVSFLLKNAWALIPHSAAAKSARPSAAVRRER